MKNVVAIVLLPIVTSTSITPLASVTSPVKALKLVLVFINSSYLNLSFSNVDTGITFTPVPPSIIILYTGFPSTHHLMNKGFMCWPSLSGFSNEANLTPYTISSTSISGAQNSAGNSNTMFMSKSPLPLLAPWSESFSLSRSSCANLFSLQVFLGSLMG
jgi:hypothetical protein